MRAIIEIFLAIIFTLSAGAISKEVYTNFKKETIIKVHVGLSPLEKFTAKLTEKK